MGTVAIMFFSIAIQSMIGFGNALIATPLLLSIGSPLTDIVLFSPQPLLPNNVLFLGIK